MSAPPTLTDVPFEVFLDALVPHLEVKEIGSLTLVSKDLKGSCDDNLVWREMYLRTIRCGITDSSVHLPPSQKELRCRSSVCDLPSPYSLEFNPARQFCLLFDYCNRGNMYGRDGSTVVNPDGRLYKGELPCIPTEVRLSLPTILPALVNIRRSHTGTERRIMWQHRAEYSEVILGIWQTHNKELGLSTVNLCQCASHYQFDTLAIPSSCKNCKSYKTTVLSKMRTQAKKPIAPLNTKLRKNQRDIKSMETRLKNLRIDEATLKSSHANQSRLSDRLNAAVTSMKDAVTKRNQKVKDDKKTARLAKAEAKKKKKAKKAQKETTETE
jgi:hypothetical protein